MFRRRHSRVLSSDGLDHASEWDRVHLCELEFDRFAVLAPPGCYLNHSRDPNAMRHGVKVFAWRPIAADDEITNDYCLNAFDGSSWPCTCGKNCTGTVEGSFFAMDPERQALLLPSSTPWEYRGADAMVTIHVMSPMAPATAPTATAVREARDVAPGILHRLPAAGRRLV
jgi:hypothetical protein